MTSRQLAPLASASLMVAVICGCERGKAPSPASVVHPRVNVQTATPERRDIWRTLTLTADVMPIKEVMLYAKTAGYLKAIYKDKGDTVSRGELIAVIESPELYKELLQSAAGTQGVESSLAGMKAAHQRALEDSRESEASVKRAEAEAEEAQRSIARAEASIRASEATQAKAQADLAPHRAAVAKAQQDQKRAEATVRECSEDVRAAQAALDNAQSEHKLARATHVRYRQVQAKDRGLIAAQLVEDAETKMVTAQGKVAAAQGKVAALRNRLDATQSDVESAKHQIEIVRSQLDSATRQVEIAKSNVDLARADQAVFEGKASTSKAHIEVAKRRALALAKQAEVAKAQTRSAELSIDSAKIAQSRVSSLFSYTEIRAPFDGVVTKRFVDVGALIPMATTSAQAKPIVQVVDPRRMRVTAHVPESQAPAIKVGMLVELMIDSLPKDKFEGAVARTSAALDTSTRTLLAEIDLDNKDGKLLPGMFARVRFKLEEHANALVVPTDAVLTEKSGKSVYVVASGKARKLAVQVGFEDATGVEILDGLKGEEQVVVINKEQLVPDAAVNAKAWAPPARK